MIHVVFRADASSVIGTGHVMRTLTLASALRERGARASFICRAHPGHLGELIRGRGFDVSLLSMTPEPVQERVPAHAAWLGATWQQDAAQTQGAIAALGVRPDWLVVDHYAVDGRWEAALRPVVGRIMVIDDLADRDHDCDLLLDQNLVAGMQTRYTGRVPETSGLMLGPHYALLDPSYARARAGVQARQGPVRRVFVFFGGTDTDNLTGRSVAAFAGVAREGVDLDVVVPASGRHTAALTAQAAHLSNVHLHAGAQSLAGLMASADIALGAGGSTTWERLCVGLPTFVVSTAENQRPIAAELDARGVTRWLGHCDVVDDGLIADTLADVIARPVDTQWSQRCLDAVDGQGTVRVCAAMMVDASTPLVVRAAGRGDEELVLEWANDPATRRNGFSPDPIPVDTHQRWFRDRLTRPGDCRMYILQTDDAVPVGQVRFDRRDQEWEIGFAVAPMFRGRGVGRGLLAAALERFAADVPGASVRGLVKAQNRSSRRVFESLGFDEAPPLDGGSVMVYTRHLT